jgi:V8-like Glu-specific endopeptidase
MRSRLPAALALLALAAVTPACAGETEDVDGESTDAVRDGLETLERPEIGVFFRDRSLCTGTLVRPDVVLTAAHCVPGSGSDDLAGATPPWHFVITIADKATHVYTVDRARSVLQQSDFGGTDAWRKADIALLHLSESVPSTVARPANLATKWTLPGQRVAVFGYGCTNLDTHAGTGTKRMREYRWSVGQWLGFTSSHDICPGDSGGPLLDVGANAVMGTNSGTNGSDFFGDVPSHLSRIEAVLQAWKVR